eukprot:m.125911 g.125911  ORF g.125911 m.125911 type:complete len:323 (-) comp14682_c0_seq1:67-1035(-)
MGDFVLVGTWPFSDKAVSHTAKLLSANENLVTALVAGVNAVEEDPLLGPYFVGKGGMPNAEGVYELDAAVMRGSDLRVGAVGALQNIVRPAAVALQVLLHSPHSFLCGQGAQKFAIDHGILYESVGTPESDAAFQAREAAVLAEKKHDTIGVVGWQGGQVAAVTSTSGMAFKHAGRVGDTPLPGSGLYADDQAGAAAATGEGDQIMKYCPCFQVVEHMRAGLHPRAACEKVIESIGARRRAAGQSMFFLALVAVDRDGRHGAASSFDVWEDHVNGTVWQGFPYAVSASSLDQGRVNIHVYHPSPSSHAPAPAGKAFPSVDGQ